MRVVSESNRKLPPWLRKHYIHCEFKSNAAVLRSFLYVYFCIYFMGDKRQNLKTKPFAQAFWPITHDK
jgi:hypothetical protein